MHKLNKLSSCLGQLDAAFAGVNAPSSAPTNLVGAPFGTSATPGLAPFGGGAAGTLGGGAMQFEPCNLGSTGEPSPVYMCRIVSDCAVGG